MKKFKPIKKGTTDRVSTKAKMQKYYNWIFGKNVELVEYTDYSFNPQKIYIPEDIAVLFKTPAFVRLFRIPQNGTTINFYEKNAEFNRYIHSIGTGIRKRNVILSLLSSYEKKHKPYPNIKHIKLDFLAEEIISYFHDIGHPVSSHVFETVFVGKDRFKKPFHEIMGERILSESPGIKKCLNQISPELYETIQKRLNINNKFEHINEGAIDVDRGDYISHGRYVMHDDIYYFNFPDFTFKRINVNDSEQRIVPVFKSQNTKQLVSQLIDFLLQRKNNYIGEKGCQNTKQLVSQLIDFLLQRKNNYIGEKGCQNTMVLIADSLMGFSINKIIENGESQAKDLQNYISMLKNCDNPEDWDLSEYLSWDNIRLFNSILDIAEKSNNPQNRLLATLILPPFKVLEKFSTEMSLSNLPFSVDFTENSEDLNPIYKNMLKETKSFQERLKKLKSLSNKSPEQLSENDKLSLELYYNLTDENFFDNHIRYTTNIDCNKGYPVYEKPYPIEHTDSFLEYSAKKSPVYLEDEKHNIIELSKYCRENNIPFPLSSTKQEFRVSCAIIGINELKDYNYPPQKSSKDCFLDPNIR